MMQAEEEQGANLAWYSGELENIMGRPSLLCSRVDLGGQGVWMGDGLRSRDRDGRQQENLPQYLYVSKN